jgi:hypothetical protein
VIVLAGEDDNDRRIVAEIPRFRIGHDVRMVPINDSVRLKGAASPSTRSDRIRTLVGKAKARALRAKSELAGLVVHEDFDGVTDDTSTAPRTSVADELRDRSPCKAALALAASESEAWLLLFPDAFNRVQSRRNLPARVTHGARGRDTGLIADPKELLRSALATPVFRESDGLRIAEAARPTGSCPARTARTGPPRMSSPNSTPGTRPEPDAGAAPCRRGAPAASARE